jgi:hypothetical protein
VDPDDESRRRRRDALTRPRGGGAGPRRRRGGGRRVRRGALERPRVSDPAADRGGVPRRPQNRERAVRGTRRRGRDLAVRSVRLGDARAAADACTADARIRVGPPRAHVRVIRDPFAVRVRRDHRGSGRGRGRGRIRRRRRRRRLRDAVVVARRVRVRVRVRDESVEVDARATCSTGDDPTPTPAPTPTTRDCDCDCDWDARAAPGDRAPPGMPCRVPTAWSPCRFTCRPTSAHSNAATNAL